MSRFRVKINRVSVSDLETRLSKHLPDAKDRVCPYVKFNFDNFKAYKTEMTTYKGSPPVSVFNNFSNEFYYETRFPDMLPAKFLVVECCDAAAGTKDSVIGTAVIDLFTLATGAELYSLPLFAEDVESLKTRAKLIANKIKAANVNSFPTMDMYVGIDPGDVTKFESKIFTEKGRLQFKIEMEQFADPIIVMKPIAINITYNMTLNDKSQLEVWFNGLKKTVKLKGKFKSIHESDNTAVSFEGGSQTGTTLTYDLEEMAVPCSFKTLISNAICFNLSKFPDKAWKDVHFTAQAKLSELITHKIGNEDYEFKVPLVGNGGKLDAAFDCGSVSGKFSIKEPPRFMQLTGGISTERGTNGRVFLPGLEVPINYSEINVNDEMLFKDTPSRPRARTLSSDLEEYSNNPLFTLKGSSAPLIRVTEEVEPLSGSLNQSRASSARGGALQNLFASGNSLRSSGNQPTARSNLNNSGNYPNSARSYNDGSSSPTIKPANAPLANSGNYPTIRPTNAPLSNSGNYPSARSNIPLNQSGTYSNQNSARSLNGSGNYPMSGRSNSLTASGTHHTARSHLNASGTHSPVLNISSDTTTSSLSSSINTPPLTPTTPHTPTGGMRPSTPHATESGHKPLPSQVHLISRPSRANSSPTRPQTPKSIQPKNPNYPNYSPMQHQYGALQSEMQDDDSDSD